MDPTKETAAENNSEKEATEAPCEQQASPEKEAGSETLKELDDDLKLGGDEVKINPELDDEKIMEYLTGDGKGTPVDSTENDSTGSTAAESETPDAQNDEAPAEVTLDTATENSEQKTEEEASLTSEKVDDDVKEQEKSEEALDPQAILAALKEQQTHVIETLFGDERPMQTHATQAVATYCKALSAAVKTELFEENSLGLIAAQVKERNATALASEKLASEEDATSTEHEIEKYEVLFSELNQLVNIAQEELESRKNDEETFQNAPEELQSKLLNYRKGIEIIHRMFNKVKDRKKDLAGKTSETLTETFKPTAPPEEWDGVAMWLGQLLSEFHGMRDANYHIVQDAKKRVEKCRDTSRNVIKSLLSAIDGIDSGLQNEPHTIETLAPFQQEYQAVIDTWFGAYDRLSKSIEQFFEKTGVEAHSAEHGTPFDPETMEALGIVDMEPDFAPDEKGEYVASVLRRGFSLDGVIIRPVQVDVIKIS